MPDNTAPVFWIIVADPGCVPERRGPIRNVNELAMSLRQLMDDRPWSHLIVARIDGDQLYLEDGTQALELIDGRSAPIARRHRERLRLGRPWPTGPENAAGLAPSSISTH